MRALIRDCPSMANHRVQTIGTDLSDRQRARTKINGPGSLPAVACSEG